jgi:hypothetical protein
MKFIDNSKKIKKQLLKGGLVVSGRNAGKTKALSEILYEIPQSVVVVGQSAQADRLKIFLKENYGFTDAQVNDKVLLDRTAKKRFLGINVDFLYKYLYLDEFYLNGYRGPFKAAVTSFPWDVRVIK